MANERHLPLEALLAQADWVTALARVLVRDPATADDVAQAAWVDVLRARPRSVVDPRSWLATLVRRKAQRTARSNARRAHHERGAASARAGEMTASAAEVVVRVGMHRELVDAVLALDEPYRETLLLRFFDNLDLAAIGERMQSKRNTVRSRLQRGLQMLRERLDRSHGGRERWLPAVVALGQRLLTVEAAGTVVASGVTIALAMKKVAAATVAVCLAVAVSSPWWPTAAEPPPVADTPAVVSGAAAGTPPATSTRPRTVTPGSLIEPSPSRTALAVATDAADGPSPTVRHVVDRDGRPLANVTMRATSPAAVRWESGERGWISGVDRRLHIPREEEQRLLIDDGYAEQFFAAMPHPDEWRATILGTALPGRDVQSNADGAFVFAPALDATDESIEVADTRYTLLTAGKAGKKPWVCGPATRVEGIVVDVDGNLLAEAFAVPVIDDRSAAILPGQTEARTDAAGEFLVRRAVARGFLRVRCDGFETAIVRLGTDRRQRIEVALQRPYTRGLRTIDGTVAETSGKPIPDATVWFGRQSTKTDVDGRFTLDASGARPQHALTVIAKGWAPLQQADFGEKFAASPAAGHDLLLVLQEKVHSIRGFVYAGNYATRVAGALVCLVDPTLLDVSFESSEARAGGQVGSVHTAADGKFALDGLGSRAYRVRAIDPRTGASYTMSTRAGPHEIGLSLPPVRRSVPGRVVTNGQPLADATVEVCYCTHVTKGGKTQMESVETVVCGADGTFVLPALPPGDAWLAVRVQGKLHSMVPVERFEGADEIVVECTGPRWLQFVGRRLPGYIGFVSAEGRPVGGSVAPEYDSDGALPLPIPAGAVAVVVGAETKRPRRLELTNDLAVHLRVP